VNRWTDGWRSSMLFWRQLRASLRSAGARGAGHRYVDWKLGPEPFTEPQTASTTTAAAVAT
jgi:hypothetical protein